MRLLTWCFPTFGQDNPLHLNRQGDRIVLAPDEFHVSLARRGWSVTVVSLAPFTSLPLWRSELTMVRPQDVNPRDYDVHWHMFRDPTQPEVLALLEQLQVKVPPAQLINSVDKLRFHDKHRYAPVLQSLGIGPEVLPKEGKEGWPELHSTYLSPDKMRISSNAYNNNRGDYPERGEGHIITRFIDNAQNGVRSLVRFGVAFGQGFRGFQYFSEEWAFKTGGAKRIEPYEVPYSLRPQIASVLRRLGCDVCHVEAIPQNDRLWIVDINPYPTANGTTLSVITEDLADHITNYFETLFSRT